MSNRLFSTGDVARMFNLDGVWRVQRLFEDRDLPEPPRFAGKRAIPGDMLPAIVDALRRRHWLP